MIPRRWEECSAEEQSLLRAVWGAGDLTYKLHDSQLEVRDAIREMAPEDASDEEIEERAKRRRFALDCSRRWGKSYLCCVVAIEVALRVRGTRIPYAAAYGDDVVEIIEPLMEEIVADAPPEYRPRHMPSKHAWVFPNGSRIVMAGVDKNPNKLRGRGFDFGVVDEAAFIDRLEYFLRSVMTPQMQGRPHARMLLASTPPVTPMHAWTTKYVPEAKSIGAYALRTIEDNPLLSKSEIEEYIAEAGGRESVECRREYFAEHIADLEAAIVPEFRAAKAAEPSCVREVERPEFFDCYVGMDPGQVDLWATLFAYYHFPLAAVVVEDELVVNRKTTSYLAEQIRSKESALWGQRPPVLRVSDTALQTICDLQNDHGLTFIPTAKDDAVAAINNARRWVQRGRVIIHPRCRTLISHLEHGVWNDRRTDFERVEGHGHFDCIHALVYLLRNVDERRNPFPSIHPSVALSTHAIPPGARGEPKGLAKMFGRNFVGKSHAR